MGCAPVRFNCAAPDDGNMDVLNRLGTQEQKACRLGPVVDGTVRSSIVMAEPPPGAGSEPAGMMCTRAEKRSDRWVVRGRKWWITGAQGASHFILLARTSDAPRRRLKAMLFDWDPPGWEIVQGLLGEAAMRIDTCRLLTVRAAWLPDQGDRARSAVSMAEIQVADGLHHAIDTAMQLMGGLGYAKHTPHEWMYRCAGQARLVDGAPEVHRMVAAKRFRAEGADMFARGAGAAR
jgi:alkylation response protein AidB-like acyl-CoA dehydrogenase